MKKIFYSMLFVLVFIGSAYAGPFVPDTYLHPLDVNLWQQGTDVIGSTPPYQVFGSQWSDDGLSLTIYFDWDRGLNGDGGLGSRLGDVFIGSYAVALRDHGFTFNNGNVAEDNIIKAGNVFAVMSVLKSDYYYNPVTGLYPLDYSNYGDNEIITAFGRVVSQATLTYIQGQSVTITFADNSFNNSSISFGQTCGNDMHKVPEPAVLFLLGVSLLGLATFKKKLF